MQSQERLSWLSQLLPDSKAAPTAAMLSASQTELMDMMHGETGKLLELRRELNKEIERISEDFVSTLDLDTTWPYLTQIRRKKSEYQIQIEDFVDMFTEVLDDPHLLNELTEEVTNIGKKVKEHANKITDIVTLKPPSSAAPKPKPRPIQPKSFSACARADMTRWLDEILPAVPMKNAAVLHDSDSNHDSHGSWLKDILPLPRTKTALPKPNMASSASERRDMSDWLKNILPLPRKNDPLPLAGGPHPDCGDLHLGESRANHCAIGPAVKQLPDDAVLVKAASDSDQAPAKTSTLAGIAVNGSAAVTGPPGNGPGGTGPSGTAPAGTSSAAAGPATNG